MRNVFCIKPHSQVASATISYNSTCVNIVMNMACDVIGSMILSGCDQTCFILSHVVAGMRQECHCNILYLEYLSAFLIFVSYLVIRGLTCSNKLATKLLRLVAEQKRGLKDVESRRTLELENAFCEQRNRIVELETNNNILEDRVNVLKRQLTEFSNVRALIPTGFRSPSRRIRRGPDSNRSVNPSESNIGQENTDLMRLQAQVAILEQRIARKEASGHKEAVNSAFLEILQALRNASPSSECAPKRRKKISVSPEMNVSNTKEHLPVHSLTGESSTEQTIEKTSEPSIVVIYPRNIGKQKKRVKPVRSETSSSEEEVADDVLLQDSFDEDWIHSETN
ncbi:unnamed protein product [Timema podura]|uniref:Uncharacterized protein n=1 Tax=Timema podura TaxID=61482 RepID=A0ABN7NR28_TIMPD|nr:unnamed protein product [Timema podura]